MTDNRSNLPTIASFWKGPRLGWLERLSLHSFVNHGYRVVLFTTEPLETTIDGVEVVPASEICEFSRPVRKHAGAAFLADIFRLYLMKKTDFVWMDSDMLSISPVKVVDGYAISWSGPDGQINNAALRLPPDSEALDLLLGHIENPSLTPEWLKPDHHEKLKEVPLERRLLAQGRMMRIVYGPRGLNHALKKTGENSHAQPMDVLSPVPWWLTDLFFSPKGGVDPWLTENTQVVHLFQNQMRSWHKNKPVPEGSFLSRYMKDCGFVL